ncbi:dephospho-CoA kinase [Enterococcus faecalis]
MSFVLGVTGGIASGKSTVVNVFRQCGFPIVDGDVIARKIVAKEQPAFARLEAVFGQKIVAADGSLDRQKLGAIVFADAQKRKLLNQTLAPFLRSEILQAIEVAKKQAPLVVVDIPLLYEGHYEKEMDQVAVVYVSHKKQLERLMERNQLTKSQAQQRIDSQWPLTKKKELADLVFDNQGTVEQTKQQVYSWLSTNHFCK